MWEAFEHAAHFGLDNLTAIIDVNRLGQRGETMVGWDLDAYVAPAEAFGWNAIEIDGHDVDAIDGAFAQAVATNGKPDRSRRAHGEGQGRCGRGERERLPRQTLDDPDAAIAELGGLTDLRIEVAKPERPPRTTTRRRARASALRARHGGRDAQGLWRRARSARRRSTRRRRARRRGLELDVRRDLREGAPRALLRDVHRRAADRRCRRRPPGRRLAPFASTFAAFISRAYDFVRMAAISRARSRSAARTRACRSARTALRRWRSRTSRRCARSTDHRAPPVRREPDGEARRGDGRHGRDLVPPHAPAGDARALLARRGVRDRRKPRPALERQRRGRARSARESLCTRR